MAIQSAIRRQLSGSFHASSHILLDWSTDGHKVATEVGHGKENVGSVVHDRPGPIEVWCSSAQRLNLFSFKKCIELYAQCNSNISGAIALVVVNSFTTILLI